MTPEGKIKKKIKNVLEKYKGRIYFYMPVPGGYGKQTIDYLGVYYGRGFGIEAKADGKPPTPNQQDVMDEIEDAGGRAFIVNDDVTLAYFEQWLEMLDARSQDSAGDDADAALPPNPDRGAGPAGPNAGPQLPSVPAPRVQRAGTGNHRRKGNEVRSAASDGRPGTGKPASLPVSNRRKRPVG